MPVTVASLQATLDLNKKGFDAGIKGVGKDLGGLSKSMGGALAAIGGIGLAVGALSGVTAAIGGMVASARESIAVGKDLEQTILSTGGVAGVTAQAARDLASSLSALTNFEDDAILSGENLLLTFTRIGKDVFPRATETMLDMSQKMGQDLKSSAIQLGKALNDPVKGIGALTRIGVSFSAQQKQQVKDFMAVNDVAKAQGVILDAIATQGFGGQAKALADPLTQMANAFGEIGESIGIGLLPLFNELAQTALPGLRAAAEFLGPALLKLGQMELGALKPVLGLLKTAFTDLFDAFKVLSKGVTDLGAALGMGNEQLNVFKLLLIPIMIPIALLAAALKGLSVVVTVVGAVFQGWGLIINAVKEGMGQMSGIGDRLNTVGTALTGTWTAFTTALSSLWAWVVRVTSAWGSMLAITGQQPAHPDLTPGSPTPMEMGLRGINSAIRAMPTLALGGMGVGGMTPIASGGGSVVNNTYLQIGSQSFGPFGGAGGSEDALMTMVQYLRQQLDR